MRDEEENKENSYVHDVSMTGEGNDEDMEGKQSAPNQTTPKELHEEEGVDKEFTQEVTEPARVSTTKQPDQNIKGAPQEENQGIGQDNNPGPSKWTVVPSKETIEIKRLRKEQQRLLNVIARLRQQIRVWRMRKRAKRTLGETHAATLVRPPKKKVRKTHVQLAIQNPVEEQSAVQIAVEEQSVVQNLVEVQNVVKKKKEQHSIVSHVEVQMEDISPCDKEVQTEAQSYERIQTINTRKCNREIQVNLPLTTTMWDDNLRIVTLQEGLMQAQQVVETLTEQTLSREKYEELQQ